MTLTADLASASQVPTTAQDIADIAYFFGIATRGAEMIQLTGVSNATLSRIMTGNQTRLRVDASAHIAVLGQFVREARKVIGEYIPDLFAPSQEGMRRWLTSGSIRFSGGHISPIDGLSDPGIAVEALAQVREAAGE